MKTEFSFFKNVGIGTSTGESRFGTPEPQITVALPKGSNHRLLAAALHTIAARVNVASSESSCRWVVQVEQTSDTTGRVYLELGHEVEVTAGNAVMSQVAREVVDAQVAA